MSTLSVRLPNGAQLNHHLRADNDVMAMREFAQPASDKPCFCRLPVIQPVDP